MSGARASVAERGRVSLVLGPSDGLRAEVFVRVDLPAGIVDPRVEGVLVGPRCRRASTLPVEARLAPIAPAADAAAAFARAVLTEPSYWTPELPNLYRLQARLSAGERSVEEFDLVVGLRRLGVRGRSFWLDGRRWVPRGAARPADGCDAAAPGEHGLAALVVDPAAGLCALADGTGVPIIAVLGTGAGSAMDAPAAAARIADWAIHPSVVLAVIPADAPVAAAAGIAAEARGLKGTLLIGRAVAGDLPPPPVVAGVDCLVVHLAAGALPHAAWRAAAPALPLVACRRDPGGAEGARRGCDILQAELAAWGLAGGVERPAWDWAGYVVA